MCVPLCITQLSWYCLGIKTERGLARHAVWKKENKHTEEIYWKEPICERENEMDTQY